VEQNVSVSPLSLQYHSMLNNECVLWIRANLTGKSFHLKGKCKDFQNVSNVATQCHHTKNRSTSTPLWGLTPVAMKLLSSGMWDHVVWHISTSVSEECAASIFRVGE
jgi:hypothetical protein